MSEIDWPPIIEVADKVAGEIAGKWAVVQKDDVKQEIMEHFLREKGKIAQIQDDESLLRRVAWTAGKRYAAAERAHYDLTDDQYFYTPEEVRQALRSFVHSDEEIGRVMGKKDDLTRSRISDNIETARLDADICMGKLKESYQAVLYKVFICGFKPEDQNEERAAYRAVDSLTQAMNRRVRVGR